jgi:Uncharacterized protein conserved in bacteria
MIILIGCAKIMTGTCLRSLPFVTEPHFQLQANENAVQMASYSPGMLMDLLGINAEIARENWMRYQHFFDDTEERIPAAFSYEGMVFKKLAPESFRDDELQFLNSHLFIASFLYGLLRPLDLIKKYRMEGNVILPAHTGKSMFDYWKPLLTDYFIRHIKSNGGILVNLASGEMKDLFDWKRVLSNVKVITPQFYTIKDGKPKTIVIYTKMCRGAMARHILKNRLTSPEELRDFEYEGFRWDGESEDYNFCFM